VYTYFFPEPDRIGNKFSRKARLDSIRDVLMALRGLEPFQEDAEVCNQFRWTAWSG